MTARSSFLSLALAGTLLAGCASTSQRPAGGEQPHRVPDSAPDKVAATRAAAGLHLEEDDERWGIEAARARKQNAETKTPPSSPGSVTAPTSPPPPH